jgi:hypothetical protein
VTSRPYGKLRLFGRVWYLTQMIIYRVRLLPFLRLQHRRCVVIPAQAIGLGSREPRSFRRAESPIYGSSACGEGWTGPTALSNLAIWLSKNNPARLEFNRPLAPPRD